MRRRTFLKNGLWLFATPAIATPFVGTKRAGFAVGPSTIPYTANAVVFNNSTYLARGAAFTGTANSKVGILSYWAKFSGNDGVESFIIRMSGGGVESSRRTDNKLYLAQGETPSGSDLTFTSTLAYAAGSSWHHFAYYWDTSDAAKCGMVTDGVRIPQAGAAGTNNIDYSGSNWGVGANHVGGEPFFGSLADLYFNNAETLDLNIPANLAKFYSGGHPVSLGATGDLPTGTAPILFLSGPAANFATNKGTGGGMTTVGSLTNDSSGP